LVLHFPLIGDGISKKSGRQEQIGLGLLGSISAFSIWSAMNPSVFTVGAFTTTPDHVSDVRLGMNVGLVLNLALGLALWLAYGKKGIFPGIMAAVTAVGLWIWYDHVVKKKGLLNHSLGNIEGRT